MTTTQSTAADEVQMTEPLGPMRYRISQHGHLYLVTGCRSRWTVDRDDYKGLVVTGTLKAAQRAIWDDKPESGPWTWRSDQGVYHLMPASGSCATCGRTHQRGTGLTKARA